MFDVIFDSSNQSGVEGWLRLSDWDDDQGEEEDEVGKVHFCCLAL